MTTGMPMNIALLAPPTPLVPDLKMASSGPSKPSRSAMYHSAIWLRAFSLWKTSSNSSVASEPELDSRASGPPGWSSYAHTHTHTHTHVNALIHQHIHQLTTPLAHRHTIVSGTSHT
jgi:hypothetical protein